MSGSITTDRLIEVLVDFFPTRYVPSSLMGAACVCVQTTEPLLPLLGEIIKKCETIREASEILSGARTDSFGPGVFLYWPRCKLGETFK